MANDDHPVRIGILWRGGRAAESPRPRPNRQLGSLFDALAELRVTVVPIPYADDAVDAVRDQLMDCGGVLVWVNPT